ncbi:MAG: hypothetical protein K5870_03925 [Lachnospiraceae bacterium]|nr:hypothetical protein [Lachnospiraceae bacterium]
MKMKIKTNKRKLIPALFCDLGAVWCLHRSFFDEDEDKDEQKKAYSGAIL